MKTKPLSKAKPDVPVMMREQLGKGVRGKYFKQYTQQCASVAVATVETANANKQKCL